MGNCLPFSGDGNDDMAPLHLDGTGQSRRSTNEPIPTTSTQTHNDPPPYTPPHQQMNVGSVDPFYRTVNDNIPSGSHMSEEEQMRLARHLGLIQHLPTETYVEGGKGDSECIICMVDFEQGDKIRFLPCMHCYHVVCIDDWLLRKFQCPSCMEPVDAALLSSFPVKELSQTDWSTLSASPGTTGKQPPSSTQ